MLAFISAHVQDIYIYIIPHLQGGYAPIYPLLNSEAYVTTVAENIRGAYPPSRCGISDLYLVTAEL